MHHNFWIYALEARNLNYWAHEPQLHQPTHPRACAQSRGQRQLRGAVLSAISSALAKVWGAALQIRYSISSVHKVLMKLLRDFEQYWPNSPKFNWYIKTLVYLSQGEPRRITPARKSRLGICRVFSSQSQMELGLKPCSPAAGRGESGQGTRLSMPQFPLGGMGLTSVKLPRMLTMRLVGGQTESARFQTWLVAVLIQWPLKDSWSEGYLTVTVPRVVEMPHSHYRERAEKAASAQRTPACKHWNCGFPLSRFQVATPASIRASQSLQTTQELAEVCLGQCLSVLLYRTRYL